MKKTAIQLALLVMVLFSLSGVSSGQAATGELSITVIDSDNAVIPNAEVTIIGMDTGAVVRTLKTNSSGIAEVPLLQPGRYKTHVAASGF